MTQNMTCILVNGFLSPDCILTQMRVYQYRPQGDRHGTFQNNTSQICNVKFLTTWSEFENQNQIKIKETDRVYLRDI